MNKKSIKLTYKFCTPSKLNGSDRALLLVEIQELIKKAWGHFDEKFLNEHIFCKSERLVMANKGSELIGFCASKQITLLKKTILYIEFTVVDPTYQGHGIGPKLTYFALRKMIFRNLFKAMFGGINVMFLTPNIRALTKVAQISGEIYPDPYAIDTQSGRIKKADDETWAMASELIKISDNPNRRLDREGLVLHGSYAKTPSLIYESGNIPWHFDESINNFARHYLKYGEKADREFVVRARITLLSILNNYF